MAVNLSPIWGAGAQLLDNSGNVLSGGKIYTYAAGTTTQVTTYTSNTGVTANSNPIVLNSAGRVPYEIWLTDGQNYKFVLKDSNDVLIGTWDNLSGINSNFVAYTNQQEIQTATAGQTVFNLTTMQYLPGTGNLSVFVDGVNQYGPGAQYAFEETDQTTVTFASGLHVGASVKFTSTQIENAGVADASQISYTYPATDAVTQNVEERLAQYVSVKDFGAVGDGVTDDSAAIQNALDHVGVLGGSVFLPTGVYNIGSNSPAITIPPQVSLLGEQSSYRSATEKAVELLYSGTGTAIYAQGMFIECSNFAIRATAPSGVDLIGILHDGGWFARYSRLTFRNFPTVNGFGFKMTSGPVAYGSYACCLDQLDAQSSAIAFWGRGPSDGITTLTLKDVQAERITTTNAQILILNGSFTVLSGTAVYLGSEAHLTMVGVDIEGSGDYGILVDDASASLVETGTIWLGWGGTNRVFNNGGTIENRSYGPVSVQQTLSVNTPIKIAEAGGQSVSNGVFQAFISEYFVPSDLVGGSQTAYRQWYRFINGTNVLDHHWEQHAFIKKNISTASTSAATIATIPVTNGTGLKLSVHAQGGQVGDAYYSNSRGCNVINSGGTLTIVQDTQVTCGSPGAISFVASGSNVLVQWTPTTANASSGTMNIEIRGPWTSYT